MSELQDMLRVQARLHRKQGANALGDLFENALNEIELLKKTYNQLFDAVQGEREQLAKANERVKELEAHNELLMKVSWEMKEGKPDAFYKIKDARNTQASDALKKLVFAQQIEGAFLFAEYLDGIPFVKTCSREISSFSDLVGNFEQLRKEQD